MTLATERQARGEDDRGGVMCPMSAGRETPIPCRGARCMAWRWTVWPAEIGPVPDDAVGYCGLAGVVHLPVPYRRRDTEPAGGASGADVI